MDKNTFAISDKSHVMMSDDLRGQVPELDDIDKYESNFILFVSTLSVIRRDGDTVDLPEFVASAVSILADVEPELEIRLPVPEAFDIIRLLFDGNRIVFNDPRLDNGNNSSPLGGSFVLAAARLQDIDNERALCVLSMKLQRV